MGITKWPEPPTTSATIALPTVHTVKANTDGLHNLYRYPDPVADDGSFIDLPSSNSAASSSIIRYYNQAGTEVWSLSLLDISAVDDYFVPFFWLDTVDEALWVWTYNADTTPDTYSLYKIALLDGAVTSIGSCQPGDGLFLTQEQGYTERASAGSGDFYFRYGRNQITISSVDGSIVTPASVVQQNSINIDNEASYQTSDGLLYFMPKFSKEYSDIINLQRGGLSGSMTISIDLGTPACYLSTGNKSQVYLWGDYIAFGDIFNSNNTGRMPRFFEREDFDRWLHELADAAGFPGSPN